ncbi:Crp/Fnr family transcriptional regulator [Anaerofustis sp.]|uniref:Crp/Fnr family transcriptional regulator n=1 Tax=Anaerofustis sp. TaxID=1872517 RepID=UPI0025B90776|nr:Crp/Fnr family transcriptional regulator [Anaerofustis sp.]
MDFTLISKSELFHGIEREAVKKVVNCSYSRIREYSEGEIIFKEEDKPYYLYVLLEGDVIIVKDYPSGNRNIFYEVENGEIFGDLFHGENNNFNYYDAICTKKSKILIIPWNFFFNVCDNPCIYHKMLIKNIMHLQADKSLSLMKKIHLLSATTLEEKIALYLLENMNEENNVYINMTRETMADFFGVKRPSLSRSLMKMQKENLIKINKKNIKVLNTQNLEDLCSNN